MKKVLIISSGYTPIIDNKNGAIQNLVKLYLMHNGETGKFSIVVYSAKDKGTKPDFESAIKNTEFRVIDISKKKDRFAFKLSRLRSILFGAPCARNYIKDVLGDINDRGELNEYDLIIIENCVDDLAYIGKHLKTKTPIVLHLHNDYLGKERADAKKATEYLSQIWCVSNYLSNRVNEIAPEANKAVTIYNAINMGNFERTLLKKEKEEIRSRLGFEEDDFVFIYVGRIMKVKGVLPLVKAFDKLSSHRDNVRLLVIGDKKKPGARDAYYDKFLRAVGRNDMIKYLGGVENENLYKYYQIANCQVIPSVWQEAFGLIALEGKASNLRIISTGTGGLKEILDDEDIVVDDLKIDTLKAAMENVLSLAERSEIVPKRDFSEEKFVSEIDRRIEELTKSKVRRQK